MKIKIIEIWNRLNEGIRNDNMVRSQVCKYHKFDKKNRHEEGETSNEI